MSNQSMLDSDFIAKFYEATKIEPRVKEPPSPTRFLTGVMGDDPMSPYPNFTSRRVYTTLADKINNKPYKAMYPQSFVKIPSYFADNGITPYFAPTEDEDFAPGVITISGMIELIDANLPLTIINEEDMDDIVDTVRDYINLFQNQPLLPESTELYLDKAERFIEVMTKGIQRRDNTKQEKSGNGIDLLSILSKFVRR